MNRLMNRSAELNGGQNAPSPFDWYVDPVWVTERLIDYAGFEANELIWDPACGMGKIVTAFFQHGYSVYKSDISDRPNLDPMCSRIDFLTLANSKVPEIYEGFKLSIVCNPPYSYEKGIAEAFCRRALELATAKVAMLLPLKWLASKGRYTLFNEHPPRTIYVLSERPSMPPGAEIEALGDAAYKRGKVDYVWIVWDVENPTAVGETRTVWIAPRVKS